jgi:hypothetical protein
LTGKDHMATDLLEKIRSEIDERLAQLRPLLSEYERLTAAAETLAAVDARPLVAVNAEAEVETPYAERPSAPPAQEVQEPPAEAPSHPAETPRRLSDTPVPAEEPPSAPAVRRPYPLRGADGSIKLAMSLRTTPLLQPTTPRPAATRAAAPTPTTTQVLEQPPAPSTLERDAWAGSAPAADGEPREPASPTAVRQAILSALEHGSHTASELVMVTAMSTPEIRGGLIRLSGRGAITKVKRRGDGKTAYALPFARA